MNNTDGLLYLIGLASWTYFWLDINHLYFTTIADLIHNHNEYIRQKAIEEVKECIRQKELEENDESEDESEDENEDE